MNALAISLVLAFSAAPLDPPRAHDAPPLEEPTAVGSLITALEEEIAHFSSIERGADERQRVTIRASLNWRIVAAELLAQGKDAGEPGLTSVLVGSTLAAGRGAIDAMLIAIHRVPGEPRPEGAALDDSAQEFVRMFNEVSLARGEGLRTLDSRELRLALAQIVSPLVDASTRMGSPCSSGHWLRAGSEPAAPDAPNAQGSVPIDALEARAAAAALSPAARAAFDESIAFLRRGVRFTDLAPAVTLAIDRLSAALDLAEAVETAAWLGEESRARWRERLDRALAAFRDPAARDSAALALEQMGRAGRLLASLDAMGERRARLAPIADAIDAACSGADDGGGTTPDGARMADARLERLEMVVDRMVAYRAALGSDLPRDLAPAGARLREGYERAERGVIDEIASLVSDERVVTDPAAASLLAAQAQHLDDIERLARLPEQSRTLSTIQPRAQAQIVLRTRRLGQGLADPSHLDEARRALDRLERTLAACDPIPFERQLAENDAAALDASGGRCAELLEAVRAARVAWVESWAQGESDSGPAARLDQLLRLVRAMAQNSAIVAGEEGTAFLNAWSLWEMPDPYQARALSDLAGRLALATAAAVGGDDARFAHELDALEREAPLARLVGRLRTLVRPALAPLPEGAAGTLGQVATPMPEGAWLGGQEALIAELCRWGSEVDDALARGLADEAAARQVHVDALSEAMLAIIDKAAVPEGPGEFPSPSHYTSPP